MKPTRIAPLSVEYSNVELGDARLRKRLMSIADAADRSPSASLPQRSDSCAALEGTYRFVENVRVSAESVLDAHVSCTIKRAKKHPQVFVIHDTTEFKFDGEKERDGLGWLHGEKAQGFLGHFSICTTLAGEPLGTLGLYAWRREGQPKGRRSQQASQCDPNRESLRWIDSALQTGELLHDKTEAIHLMDREGDSYELMTFLKEHNQRFVIRLSHNRRLEKGRSSPNLPKLFETLSGASFFFDREIKISARKKTNRRTNRKRYPLRNSRMANLEVRAISQEIFIGHSAAAHLPPSMQLNFVEIREPNPPENEEPIIWRLVTTEPIDTNEQVAAIVDAYRKRWVIEEFFKAIKTGCRYQKHQLQSSRALLILLAIETGVAWRMLLARWLAHHDSDATGEKILNATQLLLLTELIKRKNRKIPKKISISYLLYEIAELGGHIKNNGPPGWLVIRRGFQKLLTMESGWFLARERYEKRCDQ